MTLAGILTGCATDLEGLVGGASRGVHAVGCGSVVLEKVEYRPLLLDLWGQ